VQIQCQCSFVIQVKKHAEDGIDPIDFAELLMTSGIVLMDNIKWLSFHSGYDFGYLLKVLTDQNLPADESEFFELLRIYFPTIYDVKYLMKSCKNLKGECNCANSFHQSSPSSFPIFKVACKKLLNS